MFTHSISLNCIAMQLVAQSQWLHSDSGTENTVELGSFRCTVAISG